MSKHLNVAIAVVLTLSLAVPAHASHCFSVYGLSNWTYSGGAYRETSIDDPCEWYFGYRMDAAALPNPYATISQTFTVPTTHTGFSMSLEVQTQSISGATYWDELKIIAQNLTTGESELIGLVKGNQLTSTCQRFDFTVTKNYSNAQVRITINAQPFTSLDMYVDNVAFYGHNC